MTKECWVNLPVKDVLYQGSFSLNLDFLLTRDLLIAMTGPAFYVGNKSVVARLFSKRSFKSFAGIELVDANEATEELFPLDAETREEVD